MGDKNKKPPPKTMPGWMNFLVGGTSGMLATCVVQPMDLVKTRMQLMGPAGKNASTMGVIRDILKAEGFSGFYTGLSAGLFRQATYTTGRMGVFNSLFEYYKKNYGVPSFPMKIGMGTLAGGMGAFVGTPAEVALIRMTADGRLPPDKRRNYKNVFNALGRMTREEGITSLWRGATATITRAMVVNAAQLGTYAQVVILIAKRYLPVHNKVNTPACEPPSVLKVSFVYARDPVQRVLVVAKRGQPSDVFMILPQFYVDMAREALLSSMGEGIGLHFAASMISGLITSASSLPVDIVKTRVQNAAKGTGQMAVLMSVIKNEGVLALWSGFLPTYAKIGPHTVLTFLFMEQLNSLYFKSV